VRQEDTRKARAGVGDHQVRVNAPARKNLKGGMRRKLRPQEMRKRTKNILLLVEERSPGVEVLSSITDELLHLLPQQCQEASRLTEIHI
jgi:hypothetical protein